MGLIEYSDLTTISNALDIEGDYTVLEANLRNMTGQKFVDIYKKLRDRLSAPETAKCMNIIIQLTGFEINDEVARVLLTDKFLVKYLNDKRVKNGELVQVLRNYRTNGIQEKAKEIKENPEDKTYTYHRFFIGLTSGDQARILVTDQKYEELRARVAKGQKTELAKFFKRYGISPSDIKTSSVKEWKLTWLERETMILNIQHGKIGIPEKRFLQEGNFNYSVISKEEIKRGINASHLEKLFGLETGALRKLEEKEKPITLDLDFEYDLKANTIDLGIQKMFMGQNESIFNVFSIRNLYQYVVDIPENEYVVYDSLTGTLIPLKEGSVDMTVSNINGNKIRKITLSVGPSPKQSLKDFIHKKKSMGLKPETKKDSQ